MALTRGSRLGSYEILSLIGVGGMGEVYKAKDTTLGRFVAVRVLPDNVAEDEERLARFRREAQLLASLNHAHIATIHRLEEEAGQPFLVLELVEGRT
jgi:serine/threonine protein kinase